MSIRFSACALVFGIACLCWAASWPTVRQAVAQQPAQTPADEKPKYTPEQQRRLDEATKLNDQVLQLHSQAKYADAFKPAEQALAIRKEVLGEKHPDYATSLTSLALLYHATADYPKAELLYRQALEIKKEVLGEKDPDYAQSLNNLAYLYGATGDYAKAEPLLQQALAIRKEVLGEKHPDYATSLHELASLRCATGDYTNAEQLFRQVIAIREEVLGKKHPDYAQSLNNLGVMYCEIGDYTNAETLFRQSLAIREEVLGKKHPDYALSLNNLAFWYQSMGDYAKAEPLYRQALAIYKEVEGEKHPDYATSLDNLAGLYDDMGDYAKAEPLWRQALAIRKEVLGEKHPEYATSLTRVGLLYEATADYAKAEPLYRQASAIYKDALGEKHPAYADSLDTLALLYDHMGEYVKATELCDQAFEIRKEVLGVKRPAFAKSLESLALQCYIIGDYAKAEWFDRHASAIYKEVLGKKHPAYAGSLNRLACLREVQGDYAEALPLFNQAAEISASNLELTAAVQSERQQLVNIQNNRSYLDGFVSCALLADAFGPQAYEQMLAWKGAVTLRQRLAHAARHSNDPEEQKLWERLQSVSSQLATASRTTPDPQQHDVWYERLLKLTREKEDLEAQLSARSAEFRKLRLQTKLSPDQLAAKLPPDAALVDLLQFNCRVDEKQSDGSIQTHFEQHLAAFVVRHDAPLAMIDLGLIGPINEAIGQWRETYGIGEMKVGEQPGSLLQKLLWMPLAQHLDGIHTVLISPDGEASKFPWGALPGSKPNTYLIEEIGIAVVPVPQMLPDLLEENKSTPVNSAPTLLLVGDVNYDAVPGALLPLTPTVQNQLAMAEPHRSAIRGDAGMQFNALPGTAAEIGKIDELYQNRFGKEPRSLKKEAATVEALRTQAPSHRCLHLATHGFFAPPTVRSALAADQKTTFETFQTGQERDVVGFNPGLLSGLALAGANRANQQIGSVDPNALPSDDGVMTALEVASLDLQGVDLAVLSACKTGLGQSAGGEGLLGLQRAFQVAGARTTVSSLWSVDDDATQTLMTEFYKRLWDKEHPVGKLEALRQAQLAMLERYDPQAGQMRGLEREQPGADRQLSRLSPRYWAAFVLSGDWR